MERADGTGELIPTASRSGYSFVTWRDAEGKELEMDSLAEKFSMQNIWVT